MNLKQVKNFIQTVDRQKFTKGFNKAALGGPTGVRQWFDKSGHKFLRNWGQTFNIDSAEKPLSENGRRCGRRSVAFRIVEMAAEILEDIDNRGVRYPMCVANKLGKSGTQVGYYPTCASAWQFINRIQR